MSRVPKLILRYASMIHKRFTGHELHKYRPVPNDDHDDDDSSRPSTIDMDSTDDTQAKLNHLPHISRWQRWCRCSRRLKYAICGLWTVGHLAILIWLTLDCIVIHRLIFIRPRNGIQEILSSWKEPGDGTSTPRYWQESFSRGIVPVACHSHNDYWRAVPLFDAISAGCTAVEADIWLQTNSTGSQDLYVGHQEGQLQEHRTLQNLYLTPLAQILENQNLLRQAGSNISVPQYPPRGIFDTNPNATLHLVLDFKTSDHTTWSLVQEQLAPFRMRDWLTYWTSSGGLIRRPISIVATGDAPFDLIIANTSYRYIFYDAPLSEVSNFSYDTTNSLYASMPLGDAIGSTHFGEMSAAQRATVRTQTQAARSKGLLPRYWGTPSWPIASRNRIWSTLMEEGVGMLSVDDVYYAAKWDWKLCIVGGINICG